MTIEKLAIEIARQLAYRQLLQCGLSKAVPIITAALAQSMTFEYVPIPTKKPSPYADVVDAIAKAPAGQAVKVPVPQGMMMRGFCCAVRSHARMRGVLIHTRAEGRVLTVWKKDAEEVSPV